MTPEPADVHLDNPQAALLADLIRFGRILPADDADSRTAAAKFAFVILAVAVEVELHCATD